MKGKRLSTKERMQEFFFFSDGKTHFSMGIWKEELPRVWGHLLTHSGIKVDEICVRMDGVKLNYLYMVAPSHWKCP